METGRLPIKETNTPIERIDETVINWQKFADLSYNFQKHCSDVPSSGANIDNQINDKMYNFLVRKLGDSGITDREKLEDYIYMLNRVDSAEVKKQTLIKILDQLGYDGEREVRSLRIEIKKTEDKNIKVPTNFKLRVLETIAKDKAEGTELIVKRIEKEEHIYTTRDDEKSEMWIYNEGVYIPEGRTFIKEFCRETLGKVFTTNIGNLIIAKIEADTYIEQEEFFNNVNEKEVPVMNGILNIFTRKLRPFNPKEIFFNKLPIVYDKDNFCPNIIKHFQTVLKDKTDLPVMQELFGFLLLKEYKIEKAIMLSGNGRNGKSKTIELMKRFLGINNCSGVPLQDLDNDNYSKAELLNKMANLAGDISSKALSNDAWFKALTGRDLIGAARKFKTRVNFTNYAKMIFSANELPKVYDNTRAFWDRWVLLEFPYTFVNHKELLEADDTTKLKLIDTEIIEKITKPEEMSGLLNWALIGLERLLKNSDFSHSIGYLEVKKMWQRKSDSFMAFCEDFLEEEYEGQISKKELRSQYSKYCKIHKSKGQSEKSIRATLMDNYGVSEARTMLDETKVRVWEGIKWKEGVLKND